MAQDLNPADLHKKQLVARVGELRTEIRQDSNVQIVASNCGGVVIKEQNKEFVRLLFFGRPIHIEFPGLVARDAESGQELSTAFQALLLYYLKTADGAPIEGRWIAFADLPDGRFYNQAFQGYTGGKLVSKFGNNIQSFALVAKELDGTTLAYGDAGYAFHILPRVSLAVVAWQGDEEFPPSYKVLFDASIKHYLPTDVCATLGSMLTHKLLVEVR